MDPFLAKNLSKRETTASSDDGAHPTGR